MRSSATAQNGWLVWRMTFTSCSAGFSSEWHQDCCRVLGRGLQATVLRLASPPTWKQLAAMSVSSSTEGCTTCRKHISASNSNGQVS